jgi:hypothetical protein
MFVPTNSTIILFQLLLEGTVLNNLDGKHGMEELEDNEHQVGCVLARITSNSCEVDTLLK